MDDDTLGQASVAARLEALEWMVCRVAAILALQAPDPTAVASLIVQDGRGRGQTAISAAQQLSTSNADEQSRLANISLAYIDLVSRFTYDIENLAGG